jgi:hypothetical protein
MHESGVAVRDFGGMRVDAREVPHPIAAFRPIEEHLDRGDKRSSRNRKAADQFHHRRRCRFRAHIIHGSKGSDTYFSG